MPQNDHPVLRLIQAFNEIPRTTKSFLVLNVVLYMNRFVSEADASLNLTRVYTHGEWYCLLLAPVHHLNPMHLVINMLSLLHMGPKLERRMGGGWFCFLVCVFTLLSGPVYVLLQALLALVDDTCSQEQVVGFSGVLFGLSVVKNDFNPDGVTNIWTAPVPNRYVAWVELLFIQWIHPEVSFIGHLAGVLVGELYARGPLETIMKKCAGLGSSVGDFVRWLRDLIDGVRGIRHWAREEGRIDELRNNRLRRFEEGAN